MSQYPVVTPRQRTFLVRGTAIAAAGLVVAGVAGTAGLTLAIEQSVHPSTTAGTTGAPSSTGSPARSSTGSSGGSSTGNGTGNRWSQPGLANPGLSAPAPGTGSVSGGSHGS